MNEGALPKLRVAIVIPQKKLLCLGGLLWMQRYGALQVASVVQEAGYPVRLFNEELGTRVSAEHLARNFDVVGFSCKSSALTRAEELARAIKNEAAARGRKVVTVLGGEHISMGGDSRLSPQFDYVLRGESEDAFLALLKAIASGRFDDAQGLHTPLENPYICSSFDNVPDLFLVVGYDATVRGWVFRHLPLLWMLKKRMLPMLTFQGSRGCPYNCSFCPTPRYLQGNGYRRRTVSSALVYLRQHMARSGIRRVIFEDPTAALPFNRESHEFFEALAGSHLSMKATVLVRPDIYEDRRLLGLMRASGVSNLSIGIESLSDRARSDFNKRTSYGTIRRSIDVFHQLGFTITGLFIVGYDTDDPDCFGRIREFINETGIEKWKASPLTQMPEVPDQFLPAHRYFLWDEFSRFGEEIIDYGNGECVIFYPRHMKPSTLQRKIMEFNLSSASIGDLIGLWIKRRRVAPVLQRLGNNLAHGMVQREIAASRYFEMVEQVESPFYIQDDGGVVLREELLVRRYQERRRPAKTVNTIGNLHWLDCFGGSCEVSEMPF